MSYHKRPVLKQLFLLTVCVLALLALGTGGATAGPLEDAKAAGLVGERPDGYLGVVPKEAPLEVVRMVEEINAKRRAAYAEIATQNNTSTDAVAVLTAEKLYQRAKPGEYLMNKNGQWIRK